MSFVLPFFLGLIEHCRIFKFCDHIAVRIIFEFFGVAVLVFNILTADADYIQFDVRILVSGDVIEDGYESLTGELVCSL